MTEHLVSLGTPQSLDMAPRLDRGAAVPCHSEVVKGRGRGTDRRDDGGQERLAAVRQRLLLGVYDSEHVVTEVARCLQASGELGQCSHWARTTGHVDYRGL